MKKHLMIIIAVCLVMVLITTGCPKKKSNPVAPGATATVGFQACAATPTVIPTASGLVISNYETTSNTNALGGYWFTIDDCADGGASWVWPKAGAEGGTFTMSSPGENGTCGYAMHMSGVVEPYNGSTGYQYGFIAMATQMTATSGTNCTPMDISMWTGISFYYKQGPTDSGNPYKVLVAYTSNGVGALVCPTPGATAAPPSNGVENPPTCTDDAAACQCGTLDSYADYEWEFAPGSTWTQLQVPFSDFTPPSWAGSANPGPPATITPVLQNAKQIAWQTFNNPGIVANGGAAYNVDLWIGEVILYK